MEYSANALHAAIRALDEVVRPVVEAADDAQAADQLTLVTDTLRFLELRLADLPRRSAFLLQNSVDLAAALAEDLADESPDTAGMLVSAARRAAELPSGGDALAEVTGAIRETLRNLLSWRDPALRRSAAWHVLAGERRRITADRAWFAPLGFDTDPDTLATLDEAMPIPLPAGAPPPRRARQETG
ncbi:hypothetical protein GIS00_00785 [Nakamurella sp. YIM 132087]|uniref:Uncharacterized protein n=1 Tax=Nakamurella alba TaxID=2665158 RepID=A0A7K1FEF2_9ACTN|nr:hypothetical protein [Nakamurella alba]MTD12478.1 hypothetical protein [Nakamurella alba]